MSAEKQTEIVFHAQKRARNHFTVKKVAGSVPNSHKVVKSSIRAHDRLTGINAKVLDVKESGIVVAVGTNCVTYTFRASKIRGYAGEPYAEIGLTAGAEVRILKKHGEVSSFSIRK